MHDLDGTALPGRIGRFDVIAAEDRLELHARWGLDMGLRYAKIAVVVGYLVVTPLVSLIEPMWVLITVVIVGTLSILRGVFLAEMTTMRDVVLAKFSRFVLSSTALGPQLLIDDRHLPTDEVRDGVVGRLPGGEYPDNYLLYLVFDDLLVRLTACKNLPHQAALARALRRLLDLPEADVEPRPLPAGYLVGLLLVADIFLCTPLLMAGPMVLTLFHGLHPGALTLPMVALCAFGCGLVALAVDLLNYRMMRLAMRWYLNAWVAKVFGIQPRPARQ